MKSIIKKVPWSRRIYILLVIPLLLNEIVSHAQMPDCITGTVMYGVFSPIVRTDSFPTAGKDSTEIRSINFATGAVGPLMGGRRYYIRRNPAGGTTFDRYFYGASAMALDGPAGKFYLITQMGGSAFGDKDVIMIDPLAPTVSGTTVGTIATISPGVNMDNYHFVKMAMAPNGFIYALGVNRSSGATASTFNPLIRITPCAVPSAGCATASIRLLGYLPTGGIMDRMNLFNGDIAFDAAGNLYFFAAAYQNVSGVNKYTDSRLFRINAANIPSAAGTGTIPMSFVADFNSMDSTGASGLALDPGGNMYMTVRRYTNNDPTQPYFSELYKSTDTTQAQLMPGFGPLTDSTSAGDLAACYFPSSLLSTNSLQLSGQYDFSKTSLKWQVNNNDIANHYEIQGSEDGTNFTTITTIYPENTSQPNAVYQYKNTENEFGKTKYYRVRQSMKSGTRFYSNIVQIYLNNKINLAGAISPNPFADHFNFSIQLKSPKPVNVKLADQSGRIVYNNQFNGKTGENKFRVNDISNLKKGIYFVEISVENEIIREKIVKQ